MKQKKKIIIGSLLAVCMLVLLPAISATQIDLENNKPLLRDELSQPKHKLLQLFVNFIGESRWYRACYWNDRSGAEYDPWGGLVDVDHRLLLLKSGILFLRCHIWETFWYIVAETLGWNWEEW